MNADLEILYTLLQIIVGFCAVVSVSSIIMHLVPVYIGQKNNGVVSVVTRYPITFFLVYSLIAFISAPKLFLAIVFTQERLLFRAALYRFTQD